jgi:ketosteroid isomerase-like protein
VEQVLGHYAHMMGSVSVCRGRVQNQPYQQVPTFPQAHSLRMETRDFNISASGNIAVAHWLSRVGGTLRNGHEAAFWVRATSCCQRSNHRWLVTHEHISLPVDVMSGSSHVRTHPSSTCSTKTSRLPLRVGTSS